MKARLDEVLWVVKEGSLGEGQPNGESPSAGRLGQHRPCRVRAGPSEGEV